EGATDPTALPAPAAEEKKLANAIRVLAPANDSESAIGPTAIRAYGKDGEARINAFAPFLRCGPQPRREWPLGRGSKKWPPPVGDGLQKEMAGGAGGGRSSAYGGRSPLGPRGRSVNFCLLHCLSEGPRERRKAKSKEEKSRRDSPQSYFDSTRGVRTSRQSFFASGLRIQKNP